MDRQRRWTVVNIGGSHRDGRLVAAIGNPVHARVKVDVVERPVERIFSKADDALRACRKISHAYWIIVRVKRDVLDPLVSKVRMKISILVRCWKIASLIPGATH